MSTLLDDLRDQYRANEEAFRSLEGEIIEGGGEPTDEQGARMGDIQRSLESLNPRIAQQVEIQRLRSAQAQILAGAPNVPASEPAQVARSGGSGEIVYRSAGDYLSDYVLARLDDTPARRRMDQYRVQRAAANQTTGDNPGIVPDPVVGTLVNWIDARRPLCEAMGVRGLPAWPVFYRPHVSQHTSVAIQTAEKTELASRKMTIDRLTITATTYGGYVDLSLQDRDFTSPAIMGILIEDLAGEYAIATETKATADLVAAVTQTQTAPATAATPLMWAQAIYAMAGKVYAGVKRMPDVVVASPDVWGILAPLFPPYGAQNAYAEGFSAANLGPAMVTGLRLVISPVMPAGTMVVGASAAMEIYEQRVGTLQALEVSLLGVQVGYAGYFADLVIEPKGFVKMTTIIAADEAAAAAPSGAGSGSSSSTKRASAVEA